ncbi:MAG: transposase [Actinomycetia bacterium]|nr:transposase [Actinomycetes bacterium]
MSDDWVQELSVEEEAVLRLCKKQPLWRFLREQRTALFNEPVKASLVAMYSDSPRGRPPKNVEQKALAMLLQVAFSAPDHEVPTLTAVDKRWQVVLGCLGDSGTLLSQGTVHDFRTRAISAGFASVLLERTVALAREKKGFSHTRLRALIDSSPLLGAGRVEDTFNLIGRGISHLAKTAAAELDKSVEEVIDEAGVPLVSHSSVKAWLDFDWSDKPARADALQQLIGQFEALCNWLESTLGAQEMKKPPIGEHIAQVERLMEQDLEPDPNDPSGTRRQVRRGTTKNRQISLSDGDMRHGRKSKTKAFNGYKRHVVVDADIPGLVHATEVVAANVPEHEPLARLLRSVEAAGAELVEVQVDRGYIPSADLMARRRAGLRVLSKAPTLRNGELFTKNDFTVDLDNGTITCPAGSTVKAKGTKTGVTTFPAATCAACSKRGQCTTSNKGRSIRLHPEEAFHQQLRAELATSKGRQSARERVQVEHALARVGQIQGRRARFKGLKKNQFDLQRTAIINNCYVLMPLMAAA